MISKPFTRCHVREGGEKSAVLFCHVSGGVERWPQTSHRELTSFTVSGKFRRFQFQRMASQLPSVNIIGIIKRIKAMVFLNIDIITCNYRRENTYIYFLIFKNVSKGLKQMYGDSDRLAYFSFLMLDAAEQEVTSQWHIFVYTCIHCEAPKVDKLVVGSD